MASETELFRFSKHLLLVTGLMPLHQIKWPAFYQNMYRGMSLGMQAVYGTCIVLFTIELMIVIKTDTQAAPPVLECLTFVSVVTAKIILLQSKKMTNIIDMAFKEEDLINQVKDKATLDIYSQHVKYCNKVCAVILFFLYATGALYLIDGYIENKAYLKQYLKEYNYNKTLLARPHPVPVWFPFDKNKHYNPAICYEVFHITSTVVYNSAAQQLIISVLIYLKADLRILQHIINTVEQRKENEKISMQECLKVAIKKYQKITAWVEDFNNSFRYIVLLEYCVTSLMLAAILVQIIQGVKVWFNTSFFILSFLQLFTLSWNANEIIIESSDALSKAIYETHWYNMDKESATLIKIMLLRCQRPLSITIPGIGPVTTDAAVSVILYSIAEDNPDLKIEIR
ncbi:odorant receptor 30a-like [Sitophilus oryzae]|uniref:Odorant receptor n=1 Tax=Sitophilus oryzae TaxID=7048 RepID=A0A6J2X4B9_SITOR|nr:odorant receptor 30a-like [Sitophilus oryzae]